MFLERCLSSQSNLTRKTLDIRIKIIITSALVVYEEQSLASHSKEIKKEQRKELRVKGMK